MKAILRAIVCTAIGSSFGLLWMTSGNTEQGLGLAIIGGVLGFIISLSSVFYKTTALESLVNGIGLSLYVIVARNIPGVIENVDKIDSKTEGRVMQVTDPITYDDRLWLGGKIGVAIVFIPIAILIYNFELTESNGEPMSIFFVIFFKIFGTVLFSFFIGGFSGMAIGLLGLPGVHRRNILIGLLTGIAIGAGLTTAIQPGSKIPVWQSYTIFCAIFGLVGVIFGMMAGDNQQFCDDQQSDDDDDNCFM